MILWEEVVEYDGQKRGATTIWTTAVPPLAKQGRSLLEGGARAVAWA